jgi:hypothetical protein
VRFTIAAATVDPQTSSFDPKPLIPYMKRLGVPYHFLAEPIIESAKVRVPHNFQEYVKQSISFSLAVTFSAFITMSH